MISVLPQLPCKNRYTEDWIAIWTRELRNLGVNFEMLEQGLEAVPVTKFFTDPEKALQYECGQITTLSYKTDLDTILCLDIDFPGLFSSAIPVLKLRNPDLVCAGYLHVGSWGKGDIFEKAPGKKYLERSMFDIFDKIFVATNYHKSKIEKYFEEKFDNIEVVGFPFYRKDVEAYVKPLPFKEKHGILINGRMEQSNIAFIDKLREKFLDKYINIVVAKNRKEYYEQLNKAKVVLSLKTEETFGIGPLEAYVLGGIPICPNKVAYPEVITDERLLYSSEDDLIDKLTYWIGSKHNSFHIDIERYEQTIVKCISGLL